MKPLIWKEILNKLGNYELGNNLNVLMSIL